MLEAQDSHHDHCRGGDEDEEPRLGMVGCKVWLAVDLLVSINTVNSDGDGYCRGRLFRHKGSKVAFER